ncbi:MAG: carboxypeptidase regulatory-like domain-containing protein, partial [Gammaproteobacteria bacterium]
MAAPAAGHAKGGAPAGQESRRLDGSGTEDLDALDPLVPYLRKHNEAQNAAASKHEEEAPPAAGASVTLLGQERDLDPGGPLGGRDSIAGRVLDETGQPVGRMEVVARPRALADPGPDTAAERRVRTDEDGAYALDGLAEGEYVVTTAAESRGYAAATILSYTGNDAADLVVFQERQVWVHGTVGNPEGEPLAGVRVLPLDQLKEQIYSDASGGYGFNLKVSGRNPTSTVQFYQEGYRTARMSVSPAPRFGPVEDTVLLDVTMEPVDAATVGGQITDQRGAPVAGQTVALYSEGSARSYQGASNAQGRFLIENVEPADRYRVSVRPSRGYKDYSAGGLALQPGGHAELGIALEPLDEGVLEGQLLDANGQPVPRYALVLRSTDASSNTIRVVSDDQGNFAVDGVPLGPFRMETSTSPWFTAFGSLTDASAETRVNVVLDLGGYAVEGRVVDSGGSPIPMAPVRLGWSYDGGGAMS